MGVLATPATTSTTAVLLSNRQNGPQAQPADPAQPLPQGLAALCPRALRPARQEEGHEGKVVKSNDFFPISNEVKVQEGKVADYPSEEAAVRKLRVARSDARLAGKREKRAKAKEEEAAAANK